ncbi:MAG: hypothetical protein COT74_05235 [Bdellovibrionales bacterium CG10_big_fil_rev_8_21_14_0_10_45_34]|nr:MAG: hypothetical protein COT74_05235 [Bdellovibrionales bacterium CG10_big_fil_rev_8_21_14_0_10_45_34]
MAREKFEFLGSHWAEIEDGALLVGLQEETLSQLGDIENIDLPTEGADFEADDVVAEISASDGTIQVQTPVSGKIVELNSALVQDPSSLLTDSDETWIFRIEADDPDEIDDLLIASSGDDDED